MRILVIDDLPDLVETLVSVLELLGCEARGAGSGAEARSLLEAFTPDAVICDLDLSGETGFEVRTSLCRAQAGLREAVWVAYTGLSSPEIREQAAAAGYDLFFVKPVSPVEMLRAIQQRGAGVPA